MPLSNFFKYPSKLCSSTSLKDDSTKNDLSLNKFKPMHRSMIDLMFNHRPKHSSKQIISNETTKSQPPNPISSLNVSLLSNSISKKSITFASVFDEFQSEDFADNNFSNSIQNNTLESEDLVIIVPDKNPKDESKTEPYPFRSELPSYSFGPRNQKRRFQSIHLNLHRSKKFNQTRRSIHSMSRVSSAPNLIHSISSSTSCLSFGSIKGMTTHHRTIDHVWQRMRCSSLRYVLHFFLKNPYNPKSSVKPKIVPANLQADLIY